MQGVPGQNQAGFELGRPSRFNEIQVTGFVRAINFIAHDRMSRVGQMDADLVHASRHRTRLDERKGKKFSSNLFFE